MTAESSEMPKGIPKKLRRGKWSRRPDLNWGPADYESAALPLSYVGYLFVFSNLRFSNVTVMNVGVGMGVVSVKGLLSVSGSHGRQIITVPGLDGVVPFVELPELVEILAGLPLEPVHLSDEGPRKPRRELRR